jgi:hypothetical protein
MGFPMPRPAHLASQLARARKAKRRENLTKPQAEMQIDTAAFAVMDEAYSEASSSDDGQPLPAHARQIMYAARRLMLARNPDQKLWKHDSYFT